MNECKAEQEAKHRMNVIYEDRGEIDMGRVRVDIQPCEAVDVMLCRSCKAPGVYRIFGQFKYPTEGAHFQRFITQQLCAEHLAAWAELHGTTAHALLASSLDF